MNQRQWIVFILLAAVPVAQANVRIRRLPADPSEPATASSSQESVAPSESSAPESPRFGHATERSSSRVSIRRASTSVAPTNRSDQTNSTYGRMSLASNERVRVVRRGSVAPRRDLGFGRTHVTRIIERERRNEGIPNRYYWHNVNGFRYSHFYDNRHHWYGFYDGPRFYWARYHGGGWWWRDPYYRHWSFWANGYWWWPAPTGVLYVYVDNAYYPYDSAGLDVPRPDAVPEPPATEDAEPPAPPATQDQSWTSPDGKRMVQVVGVEGEAYLYNMTSGSPVFMKFLEKNVEKVRFSGATTGTPLQILTDLQGGGFAIFDADGTRLNVPPGTR